MTGATYVELVNGQIVMRDAEEWRDECLARYVLSLPSLKERRAWLADYEKRHGSEETDRLKANMMAIKEKAGV